MIHLHFTKSMDENGTDVFDIPLPNHWILTRIMCERVFISYKQHSASIQLGNEKPTNWLSFEWKTMKCKRETWKKHTPWINRMQIIPIWHIWKVSFFISFVICFRSYKYFGIRKKLKKSEKNTHMNNTLLVGCGCT